MRQGPLNVLGGDLWNYHSTLSFFAHQWSFHFINNLGEGEISPQSNPISTQ
jgi:hypothetical protein